MKSILYSFLLSFVIIFSTLFVAPENTHAANFCCAVSDSSTSSQKAFRCDDIQAQNAEQADIACKGKYSSQYSGNQYQFNAYDNTCSLNAKDCPQSGTCCFKNTTSRGQVLNCGQNTTITSRAQCEAAGGKLVQDCSTECTCTAEKEVLPVQNSIIGHSGQCCPGLQPVADTDGSTRCYKFVGGKAVKGTPQQTKSLLTPKPNVALPGFEGFGEGGTFSVGTTKYITVDWIARYVRWAYQYAIGIAGVFAVLMITIGGLMWIMAAGDAGKITNAKNYITGAITGLVLILGAYLILNFLNPALVSPRALTIELASLPEGQGSGEATPVAECNRSTAGTHTETTLSGKKKTFCTTTDAVAKLNPSCQAIQQYCSQPKNASEPECILLYQTGNAGNCTWDDNVKVNILDTEAELAPSVISGVYSAASILDKKVGDKATLNVNKGRIPLEDQQQLCNCYEAQKKSKTCPTGCGTCEKTEKPLCGAGGSPSLFGQGVGVTLTGTWDQRIKSSLCAPGTVLCNGVNISGTFDCGSMTEKDNCGTNISTNAKATTCSAQRVFCQNTLHSVMTQAGFKADPTKWWYFSK